MILIKRASSSLNANEIAERTGNSKHHVAKILKQLTKLGYLSSVRGPLGGFTLKRDAQDINLLHIYESIEGPLETETCSESDINSIILDMCITKDIVSRLTQKFKDYLESQTLDQY